MIIYLEKSTLFTKSPSSRFAREYGLNESLWDELWRRYKFLGYTIGEMTEYYTMKTGRKTTKQAMARWVWRTEVYMKAHKVMKEGVRVVKSEFFGEHEAEVLKELLKNMQNSVGKKSRTLI